MSKIDELLEQAVSEGVIECPKCGDSLEPDAEACACGWENALVAGGFI